MNDHYNTPEPTLEPIYDFAGYLSLDPCSNGTSLVCSDHRYTKRDDGLRQPWFGNVFWNPPYSRGNLLLWTQKALWEYECGHTDESFGLVPNDTSASWWQLAVPRTSAILFYNRRIRFVGAKGSPKFPSALFYCGPRPRAFEAAFAAYGFVIRAREASYGYLRPAPLLMAGAPADLLAGEYMTARAA
jgi:hypothetical protein